VKEAGKVLEKNQGTSEAGASGSVPESAAPESTSEADRSETPLSGNPSDHNSAKVTQISVSPIISPSPSPSNDSDQDNISLSQRINMLPKLIHKPKPSIRINPTLVLTGTELAEVVMDSTSQKSSQPTRLKPLQKAQPSATAEDSKDPEEPSISDLPNFGSPSNLFSLEKHLGGELIETPQKSTKSAPEKIDLVNQQLPKPTQQNDPEPTSIQTQAQDKTIPVQNLTISASNQPSSPSHI